METKKTTTITKRTREHLIFKATLTKKDGKIAIILKAHPLIEKIFEGIPVKTSSRWKDTENKELAYYPSLLDTNATLWRKLEGQMPITDNAGGTTFLTQEGRLNVAILRLEGLSQGIAMQGDSVNMGYTEIQDAMTKLGQLVKHLWTEYIKPIKVELKVKRT